jgi:hypothetical protein
MEALYNGKAITKTGRKAKFDILYFQHPFSLLGWQRSKINRNCQSQYHWLYADNKLK